MQQQDSSEPTGVAQVTPHPNGQSQATHLSRNRKANAAVQMKLAGATWSDIAETLGYPTPRAALVATEKAMERALREDTESREKMRKVAGARLDRLLRGVWPKAVDPDHPEHLVAADKARSIIDRHIKLYGLDAPTEVVVHTPTTTELERWVAKVVSLRDGGSGEEEFDILQGEVVPPNAISA